MSYKITISRLYPLNGLRIIFFLLRDSVESVVWKWNSCHGILSVLLGGVKLDWSTLNLSCNAYSFGKIKRLAWNSVERKKSQSIIENKHCGSVSYVHLGLYMLFPDVRWLMLKCKDCKRIIRPGMAQLFFQTAKFDTTSSLQRPDGVNILTINSLKTMAKMNTRKITQ